MLDVHPPHEKMHGIRDFLLHLFTITVGLLIALALEGCAERWHHRELRKEADANLRQEIRENAEEIESAHVANASEQANLKKVLEFFKARKEDRDYDIHEIRLGFTIGELKNASWKTASATGVLSYMEYDHVQGYAAAYQLQEKYSALQDETINEFLQLQSYLIYGFDPKNVTPTDAISAELDARRTLVHLVAMDQIATAVKKEYDMVLEAK
jgi:hypothetical protein